MLIFGPSPYCFASPALRGLPRTWAHKGMSSSPGAIFGGPFSDVPASCHLSRLRTAWYRGRARGFPHVRAAQAACALYRRSDFRVPGASTSPCIRPGDVHFLRRRPARPEVSIPFLRYAVGKRSRITRKNDPIPTELCALCEVYDPYNAAVFNSIHLCQICWRLFIAIRFIGNSRRLSIIAYKSIIPLTIGDNLNC